MTMIDKQPQRHEIEALLPWHAAGTLSRREADRVEQALAEDGELARRYALVREELAETIHLNETLGAPSPRAMEKLFAAIDAEEARAPRRRRSFDLGARLAELLSGFAPRTLAWSAAAAGAAILLQAAVITAVLVQEHGAQGGLDLASAATQGSFAVVRFAAQATMSDISHFLGAYKASLVDGPLRNMGSDLYLIRLGDAKLPRTEETSIVRRMQQESKIVGFIAVKE
ncbi:MAG TPA: hypothetical protein VGF60_17865 [Xanthobacteraceae bacterium]